MDVEGTSLSAQKPKSPIVIELSWPNKQVSVVFHYFLVCFHALSSFQYSSILLGFIIEDADVKYIKFLFKKIKGFTLGQDFVIFVICCIFMGLTKILDYSEFTTR